MEGKKNTIYSVIKPIYLFCKVFGAFPYTLINNLNIKEENLQFKQILGLKLQKKDSIFIGIQVIFLVLTVPCFLFQMISDVQKLLCTQKEQIIDMILHIIQLTGLHILMTSNILVVYMNKKYIENIFDNIYEMDYNLQQLNFSVNHKKTLKFGQKLLIASVINCILVTIPDLNSIFSNCIPYNYFLAELGSVGLSSFFAVLCFDAKQKFILIKEAIIDLPPSQQKKVEKLSFTNVTQILKIYGQLIKHCALLNITMDIVLLADISNAFLAFVISIYYSFFKFLDLHSKGMYEVLNMFYTTLYWNIYNMSLLLVVICSFNGIAKQVFFIFIKIGQTYK